MILVDVAARLKVVDEKIGETLSDYEKAELAYEIIGIKPGRFEQEPNEQERTISDVLEKEGLWWVRSEGEFSAVWIENELYIDFVVTQARKGEYDIAVPIQVGVNSVTQILRYLAVMVSVLDDLEKLTR